jgi:hypothetical protein
LPQTSVHRLSVGTRDRLQGEKVWAMISGGLDFVTVGHSAFIEEARRGTAANDGFLRREAIHGSLLVF